MSSAAEGTAEANEMKLDKQQTSFNDILDSLILALSEYQFGNGKS
jgi:hypothetical protein